MHYYSQPLSCRHKVSEILQSLQAEFKLEVAQDVEAMRHVLFADTREGVGMEFLDFEEKTKGSKTRMT